MTDQNFITTTVRLTRHEKAKLDQVAASLGVKAAVIIRQYLHEGLTRANKKHLGLEERTMIHMHFEMLFYIAALSESLGSETVEYIAKTAKDKANAFIERLT